MENNEKLAIDKAVERFRSLMEGQLERAKRIKAETDKAPLWRSTYRGGTIIINVREKQKVSNI